MKHWILAFALVCLTLPLLGQGSEASEPFTVDTVEMGDREVVLFSNNTWQYLEDLGFDGILNPYLAEIIEKDTSIDLKTYWNNDMCFSYQNNGYLKTMKDSIWMCTTDSLHPNFCIPVPGVLTSKYKYRGGRWHHGVDLDLNTGDTVKAAFSGKVRYAKYNTHGYGNLVIIRHYNGLETYYAHLSKLLVTPNEYVVAGQTIGLGGATGHAYGAHLHFETRFFDATIDPEEIFDFENRTIKACNLILKSDMFLHNKGGSTDRIVHMRSGGNKPITTGGGNYHRVRSGDSLWKISRLHGTSVDRLCQLNGITEGTTLQIGQKLRVK